MNRDFLLACTNQRFLLTLSLGGLHKTRIASCKGCSRDPVLVTDTGEHSGLQIKGPVVPLGLLKVPEIAASVAGCLCFANWGLSNVMYSHWSRQC